MDKAKRTLGTTPNNIITNNEGITRSEDDNALGGEVSAASSTDEAKYGPAEGVSLGEGDSAQIRPQVQVYAPSAHAGSAAQELPPRRYSLLPLWISLPFIVVLALLAVFLLTLFTWSAVNVKQYNAKRYGSAEAGFSKQIWLTSIWPEPWKGPYNLGTTALAKGQREAGVKELQRAFNLIPKATKDHAPSSEECMVRLNLAIGLEQLGDQARSQGKSADAEDHFSQAVEISGPCQPPDQGGQGNPQNQPDSKEQKQQKQAEGDNKRQRDKENESRTAQGKEPKPHHDQGGNKPNSSGSDPSPSPGQSQDPNEEERQKKLREQNKLGQDQRENNDKTQPYWGGEGDRW